MRYSLDEYSQPRQSRRWSHAYRPFFILVLVVRMVDSQLGRIQAIPREGIKFKACYLNWLPYRRYSRSCHGGQFCTQFYRAAHGPFDLVRAPSLEIESWHTSIGYQKLQKLPQPNFQRYCTAQHAFPFTSVRVPPMATCAFRLEGFL